MSDSSAKSSVVLVIRLSFSYPKGSRGSTMSDKTSSLMSYSDFRRTEANSNPRKPPAPS